MSKSCVCCGQSFEPRPQVPKQTYCSSLICQQARKRRWQQVKLQSDADYRANQQAAQRAWTQSNQDYWRRRRESSRSTVNQPPPQHPREDAPPPPPVKMDVSAPPPGIYRITTHPAAPRENGDSWVVEITWLRGTCACKMDASSEDLIDTPGIQP